MEDRKLLWIVIIGIAAVFLVNTFSGVGSLTGRYDEDHPVRGIERCENIEGGVRVTTGADVREYNHGCASKYKKNTYYCTPDNKADFREIWCPNGMVCRAHGKCSVEPAGSY